VFVGHSGVGKSSLLNAVAPDLAAATAAVRAANGKGRHTTTASRLYDLGDIRVIDTPGIREFGLWNMDAGAVRRYFHDFDAFALACAFSDCTHIHELQCGVRDAVANGALAQCRYDTYVRIAGTAV
jgi:ribosome biogenesis GTPase